MTAEMAAPITIASSTLMPVLTTSCPAAKAPTAAKVAWHSDTCPASPVMMTNDRKIRPRIAPFVTRLTQ